MTNKFRICRKCGNLVGMVHDSGVPMMCCGQPMDVLEPNTSEGAGEKHLPAVSVDGDTLSVNVGSVDHPMLDAHYIEWIFVQTSRGRLRLLQPPRSVDDRSVNEPCSVMNSASDHFAIAGAVVV